MRMVDGKVIRWCWADWLIRLRGETCREEKLIAFAGIEAQQAGEAEDVLSSAWGPGCALTPAEDRLPAHPHPPRQVGVWDADAFDEFRQEGRERFHRASLVAADATQM